MSQITDLIEKEYLMNRILMTIYLEFAIYVHEERWECEIEQIMHENALDFYLSLAPYYKAEEIGFKCIQFIEEEMIIAARL